MKPSNSKGSHGQFYILEGHCLCYVTATKFIVVIWHKLNAIQEKSVRITA
jgi:hypothetical protein